MSSNTPKDRTTGLISAAAADAPNNAPPPKDSASSEVAPAMSKRQVLEALSGIIMGMFVSILATSIVSSSLPKIITDLGGSQASFTWVVTATLLTTTITTPIWGKLADLTDRKRLIQIALLISVLSSAAAGLSPSVEFLIGFRALQGIGAGGLMALGSILLADIISPRERGRYMGLLGSVMAVGMVGGPLLGGVITDVLTWRWNFFVGLPFAIVAIIVLQRTLKLPPITGRGRLDYGGATLISVGVALLLLWVTFAGTNFDWASWQSFVMVGASLACLAFAVLVESRVDEPLIPLHLFKNRTVVLSVIASISVGLGMFGTSVFLSQYMQVSRGMTPTQSGLMTTPMVLGIFLSSMISGQLISRMGRYRSFMITGSILLVAGLGAMGTITYQTNLVLIGTYLAVMGIGLGMLQQNLVLAVQNTLDIDDIGSGTSLVAFFRTLGGAIGVSVLGAILTSRVTANLTSGLQAIGVDPSAMASGAMPDVNTLPTEIKRVVENSYGQGIAEIFLVSVPIALITVVCVLLLKEVPLGTRSGLQQRVSQALDVAEELATTPGSGDEPTALLLSDIEDVDESASVGKPADSQAPGRD